MDFWIKNTTSSITPSQHIVGISNLFRVETNSNGQFGFIPRVNTTSGIESPTAPFLFPANMTFHHVAVVYDSSIAIDTLYVDRKKETQTAPMPPGTKLVSFGQGNLTIGDLFKGGAPFTVY